MEYAFCALDGLVLVKKINIIHKGVIFHEMDDDKKALGDVCIATNHHNYL